MASGRPAAAGEIERADEVRALYAQTASSLVGNIVGAAMMVVLFHGRVPGAELYGWLVVFVGVWSLRALVVWRFRHRTSHAPADYERWRRTWNAGALVQGGLWGLACWLFYESGSPLQQLAVVLIVNSLCIGAVQLMGRQTLVFLAYVGLCFVPMIARVASRGDSGSVQLAVVISIIFGMASLLARNFRSAFDSVMQAKRRQQLLAQQLAQEKALAEAARQEAEVANRAKTQFFAAASHDLRQPLHALGLFAEALRERSSQDEQVVQLVNSINASVDALEELFSELLDITKIDTGAVEPKPEPVEIGAIFRKLKLHFEPVAFEKGLSMRLHGGHRHVHADPVLVERILRNLVSNAIRYTNDGGILVAARPRGDEVLLQVWDSGIGIREREQQKIFEEFYQVADDAPPLTAHQRKGLGLGLAIVKRLAALMETRVALRSHPGRGTVFELRLPRGKAPPAPPSIARGVPALGLSLDRRLVVVVEDDPAVNAGLQVLLKSWGGSVLAFETYEACRHWAETADPALPTPDLAIVDYRLESGHDGVEMIRLLRRRFGAALPAIVVTGSMMSSTEVQAHAEDFHLLLKPVVPHKLRAMIAFKLSMR